MGYLQPMLHLLLILWAAHPVYAYEHFRPTGPAQLPIGSTVDQMVFVPGSRVAYANYDLIKKDFKQTEHLTDKQIDEWIIHNFSYVSETQAKLRGIWNSHYEVDTTRTKAIHRPPNYYRSGMVEAEGGGMVDVKGNGWPPGKKFENMLKSIESLRKARTEAKLKVDGLLEQINAAEKSGNPSDQLKNDLQSAQDELATADARLTHIDGSARFGETIVEGHKQESLQHLANIENRKVFTMPDGSERRIETVETYFNLLLPGKVKSAMGDEEEEMSLYGRQATSGHGRGSDLDPDIAYNSIPRAGPNPPESYRGSNALQVSNSGAIFDYGSITVTHPDARELHGYYHYSEDAVRRGAYFDLFDSNLNKSAYALAKAMGHGSEHWEEKKSWYQKQRRDFIPQIESTEAPLSGEFKELVNLYQNATQHRFTNDDANLLMKKIRANNEVSLGTSDFLKDTIASRSNRLRHLTLHTILSGLDTPSVDHLMKLEAAAPNDLAKFLQRSRVAVATHTEGLGEIPVQPLFEIWEHLRDNPAREISKFGINEQYRNLIMSIRSGQSNSILKNQFMRDIQDHNYWVRKHALTEIATMKNPEPLKKKGAEVSEEVEGLKEFLSVPEIQAAVISNYEINLEAFRTTPEMEGVMMEIKQQMAMALDLLRKVGVSPTIQTEKFLSGVSLPTHCGSLEKMRKLFPRTAGK